MSRREAAGSAPGSDGRTEVTRQNSGSAAAWGHVPQGLNVPEAWQLGLPAAALQVLNPDPASSRKGRVYHISQMLGGLEVHSD